MRGGGAASSEGTPAAHPSTCPVEGRIRHGAGCGGRIANRFDASRRPGWCGAALRGLLRRENAVLQEGAAQRSLCVCAWTPECWGRIATAPASVACLQQPTPARTQSSTVWHGHPCDVHPREADVRTPLCERRRSLLAAIPTKPRRLLVSEAARLCVCHQSGARKALRSLAFRTGPDNASNASPAATT